MKIALTQAQQRIAPLFDSATTIELYETQGYAKETIYLGVHVCEGGAKESIDVILSLDVKVVICGAISSEYEQLLLLNHIDLYSYISGDVEDVLHGWHMGKLHAHYFSMPGCDQPRHCSHRGYARRCRNRAHRRKT